MIGSVYALIPPVLVIVMVIATKKIILSIFSGIVISALMIENFQLLPALKNIVEEAVQWAIDTANDSCKYGQYSADFIYSWSWNGNGIY